MHITRIIFSIIYSPWSLVTVFAFIKHQLILLFVALQLAVSHVMLLMEQALKHPIKAVKLVPLWYIDNYDYKS